MRRIGWLVWKDVRLFLADRGGLILTVLTPIALAIVFSLLFRPPATGAPIDLMVVDEDGGPAARGLVSALQADPALGVEVLGRDEAVDRMRRGVGAVALVLPAGSDRALRLAGLVEVGPPFGSGSSFWPTPPPEPGPAPVLLHDPSRRYEADMARGAVARTVARGLVAALGRPDELRAFASDVRSVLATAPGGPASDAVHALLDALLDAVAVAAPVLADAGASAGEPALLALLARLHDPTDLKLVSVGDIGIAQGFNPWTHNFVGMLVMFLLFMALERGKSLLDERARGTAQRLRLAPVSQRALLLGSALSTALIALGVSAVVLSVGAAGFGVEVRGSVVGFAVVLVALAIAVAGFGLLLAGVGRTSAQITTLGTFAILLMSFLGGATLPSFLMPAWVQSAAVVVPTHWATRGLAAMTWRGLDLSAAAAPAAALCAFGVVFGLVGAARFCWEDA